MTRILLPIGNSDFRSIRESGRFYVDKSALISGVIRDNASLMNFTRPRRFGKTTALTMLRSFFDLREDSQDIFKGLDVMADEMAVKNWMNKYPVIYLSLKDVGGLDFTSALSMLNGAIYNLYDSYRFIADTDLTAGDDDFVRRMLSGSFPVSDTRRSLEVLVKLISEYYQRKVIILIDEYDVPLDKANSNGYYSEKPIAMAITAICSMCCALCSHRYSRIILELRRLCLQVA